ncbi:MAG: sensor histidine kinase [Gemmatimonadaceae bacterium]
MDVTAYCPLAAPLAARLRGARTELTGRWLERIVDRVALDANSVFPTDDLLDHMPLLVLGIADYVENPGDVISAETPVVARARELGALRHTQGFGEYEILKEYEILGAILYSFLAREARTLDVTPTPEELLICSQRLFQGVSLAQQATITHYLQLMGARIHEREERLRAFNRALTHELRNRIGAAVGAGQLLDLPTLSEAERATLVGVVVRNVDSMRIVLDNLLELTRLGGGDTRQQRHVLLPRAAAEATRQLREMARSKRVTIRITGDLPAVEVNAAAVELALTNLIANAIKYADPAAADRWVEVSGRIVCRDADSVREVVVEVRDNGIGVPEPERARLFERFFRAANATATDAEGTGLGLSIVRETVQSLGGRVWAEFPDKGSVFAFALPCRRAADAAELRAQSSEVVVSGSVTQF